MWLVKPSTISPSCSSASVEAMHPPAQSGDESAHHHKSGTCITRKCSYQINSELNICEHTPSGVFTGTLRATALRKPTSSLYSIFLRYSHEQRRQQQRIEAAADTAQSGNNAGYCRGNLQNCGGGPGQAVA